MKKRTMLSSVVSVLAAGVLMGGCVDDVGEEVGEDSELLAEEGPKAGEGEESEALAVEELKAGGGEANTPTCGVLAAGETLFAGQSRASCDGRFTLIQQSDGNTVLYGPTGALAATFTQGAGNRLVMQTDGNLVVYSPSNQALWHSNTHGNPGAWLAIKNDGNLVIYSASNQLMRQTGTPNGQIRNLQEWQGYVNVRACFLYKGTNIVGGIDLYKTCGYYGHWVPSTYPGYPSYQQPLVDGNLPWNGGWASTNGSPVWATNSPSAVAGFSSGAGRVFGDCTQCLY